jgi:YD repeat-containing protein
VNGVTHLRNVYTHDAAGRVRTVSSNNQLLTTYSHNANGIIISRVYGNGTRTDYTLNPAGLPTNVTHRRGNTVLSVFDYSYYLDGNIRRVAENMNGETRTITYTYDLARRLVREEESSNIPVGGFTTTVSTFGELITAVNSAPAGRPVTIRIAQDMNVGAITPITIPTDRDIVLSIQNEQKWPHGWN